MLKLKLASPRAIKEVTLLVTVSMNEQWSNSNGDNRTRATLLRKKGFVDSITWTLHSYLFIHSLDLEAGKRVLSSCSSLYFERKKCCMECDDFQASFNKKKWVLGNFNTTFFGGLSLNLLCLGNDSLRIFVISFTNICTSGKKFRLTFWIVKFTLNWYIYWLLLVKLGIWILLLKK